MQEVTSLNQTKNIRKFLTSALLDVRYGHLEIDKAKTMCKVAAQINSNMQRECEVQRLLLEQGQEVPKWGDLQICE